MNIEIVAIGDEILDGSTINTNAAFLSRELSKLGYKINKHSVLPDDEYILKTEIEESISTYDLIIATGGLGPTFDDKTKNVVADIFEKNKYQKEQSLIPYGIDILKNDIGTASGFIFKKDCSTLVLLPGVPCEMESMFFSYLIDYIKANFKLEKKIFKESVYICLKREDDVEPILEDLRKLDKEVEIGIYPSFATLKVVFTVTEISEDEAYKKILPLKNKLYEVFDKYIFPGENGGIHIAVRDLMLLKGKTLAVAESCSGGALSSILTSMPNSSLFFLGSVVSYSNDFKKNILNVDEKTLSDKGAVSIATVNEMVKGILGLSKSDIAIAISGVAGPSGGSDKTPVGTVMFAIAANGETIDSGVIHIPGDRNFIVKYSVSFALSLLWVKINSNLTYFIK